MNQRPKRLISPIGKRHANNADARPQTNAEQASAHLGATEREVVPTAPPPASAPKANTTASEQIEPRDEITPG